MDQEDGHASPGQNRSSSLSDIGDHADENVADLERALSAIESDSNDTEAETERLEGTPQKSRENHNLVLTAANSKYSRTGDSPLKFGSVEVEPAEETRQASDVVSSRASSVDNDQEAAGTNRSKKRKRSNIDYQYLNDQRPTRDSMRSHALGLDCLDHTPELSPQPTNQSENSHNGGESSHGEEQGSGKDTQDVQEDSKAKRKRGKRRPRKASDEEADLQSPPMMSVDHSTDPILNREALGNKVDDVEVEDSGEYAGSDNVHRDDEGSMKKRSAMDSLNAIEKCFASLRDKLFDERLTKLDAELAMLAEPNVTHPELLGMNQVLEQRRDEKIQHETTLLKYKLGSLQTKSKAEKAQVHGQYMQTVRDIRDLNLEQVNKEWYQIHKERRSRENEVPDYTYGFPTRRSQQITHQTAYNKEVSLLSGLAKYRGFPAAPEICGAKPSEIDADLEKMGIVVQQPTAPIARHPPSLRASLSATAVLQRSKPVADEHFLEQNPWANPQHPAHLHRQASALSRTASPLTAPVSQKRPPESSVGLRSAPAVTEAPLGPSVEANSTTDNRDTKTRGNKQRFNVGVEQDAPSGTPSRQHPPPNESLTPQAENQHGRIQRNKFSPLSTSEKAYPSVGGRHQVQEIHVRPYMPRVSYQVNSPGSGAISKLPASPSSRFPIIKAEDISRLPGRSPTPQHYHQPVPITVNGGVDRFAAS
ncbi:MAG: hypothetical protein Q9166_003930 [cf. Caloplaca sp. 2 TL-2023]